MTKEEVNELFSDDRYLSATNEVLHNAMQQLVNDTTIDNNIIARALVINAVLSDRHYRKVERFNIFLTFIIILLTACSLFVPLWLNHAKTQSAALQSVPTSPRPVKQSPFVAKERK